MLYKTAFPDYDDTITIPEGWTDDSWHNDVCPKIFKGSWVIWCEFKDPNLRESGGRQFLASLDIDDHGAPMHEFDTFAEALAFFQKPTT